MYFTYITCFPENVWELLGVFSISSEPLANYIFRIPSSQRIRKTLFCNIWTNIGKVIYFANIKCFPENIGKHWKTLVENPANFGCWVSGSDVTTSLSAVTTLEWCDRAFCDLCDSPLSTRECQRVMRLPLSGVTTRECQRVV